MPRPKLYEKCRLWYCDAPHYARGYCARHYQNNRRTGYHIPPSQSELRLVEEKLQEATNAITNARNVIVEGRCLFCNYYVGHAPDCVVPILDDFLDSLVEEEHAKEEEDEQS